MALQLLLVAAMLSTGFVLSVLAFSSLLRVTVRSVRSACAARRQRAPAFPVQIIDEGEGTYRIEGVMRATEEEIVWTIDARTRANAIAKAELRGAVVTQVMKLAPTATPAPVELIELSDHPVTTV